METDAPTPAAGADTADETEARTTSPGTSAAGGPDVVTMTTAMLKALSHPLRRAALREVRQHRYLRAADVAERLGEPANKVSFHLRVLADAGLIAEAPEQARDRRDRVWTVVPGALTVGSPEHPVADQALGDAVMSAFVEEHYAIVQRVVAWAPEYVSGRDAEVHGTFVRDSLQLTPAEFEALLDRLDIAVREAKEQHDESAPDTRYYDLDVIAADNLI
ncbi:ArsR/SmtB family transcription factor [Microbacterium sp.]|uniref:ArsR/SmtB family transcription factor n=1 Tax=Microbacterium sp. TaxID=51671 RepID=UPI003C751B21